ncbi:MAG: DUF1674 domain-containing protein [Devosia sp.]|nr:DUF1674 domain-containing protein [Devosia sp.]
MVPRNPPQHPNPRMAMSESEIPKTDDGEEVPPPRILTPAAQRALAEAEARRLAIDAATAMAPKEKGGRGGLEPGRYGDWEIKGLTSDF